VSGGCRRVSSRLSCGWSCCGSFTTRVITSFQWMMVHWRGAGSHNSDILMHSIERKSTLKTSFQGYSPKHTLWLNCHSFEWRGEMWGRGFDQISFLPFFFFFSKYDSWILFHYVMRGEMWARCFIIYPFYLLNFFLMIHGYISNYAMATSNEWMNEWMVHLLIHGAHGWHY
jgi:hypothetical protein